MIRRLLKCVREYKKPSLLAPLTVSMEVIIEMFRRMRFPGQIILGELGKSCDFARDLLKIGCYRGTAIAVPYG